MSLRASDTIQKFLLSTTSRLIGEYEADGILIAHAWPNFQDRIGMARMFEGPTSRNAFILSFETPPLIRAAGVVIPSYEPFATAICCCLSVLYGKRFDNHGPIETTGFFRIPDLSAFGNFCSPLLPQNTHAPRADFPISLNLVEFKRVEPLLKENTNPADQKHTQSFLLASQFYLRALRNAEQDVEIAYLHLITAAEILSNAHDYLHNELCNSDLKDTFAIIEAEMHNGTDVITFLRGRLRQIKRRVLLTICGYMDDEFFAGTECREQFGRLRRDTFEKAVSAAYDIRSRHLHTGTHFGNWIAPQKGWNNEMHIGRPVLDDAHWAKILAAAPTYVGLERIVRYCLLKFSTKLGVNLADTAPTATS